MLVRIANSVIFVCVHYESLGTEFWSGNFHARHDYNDWINENKNKYCPEKLVYLSIRIFLVCHGPTCNR